MRIKKFTILHSSDIQGDFLAEMLTLRLAQGKLVKSEMIGGLAYK